MNKILLIVKREYLSRVKKKSFIIMSLVTPLLLALLMVVPMWLALRDMPTKEIVVVDDSGFFVNNLKEDSFLKFEYSSLSATAAKEVAFAEGKYAVLEIPDFDIDNPTGFKLTTLNSPSFEVKVNLENQLKSIIEEYKLQNSGIDTDKLESLRTRINLETNIRVENGEEKEAFSEVAYIVGYVGSFLIYILIFAYGVQTMRGVIEEKTSRIVEVIISSVKPYQLMAGKIIGIGAVGLTQFFIWVSLTIAFYVAVGVVFQVDQLPQTGDMGMQSGYFDEEKAEMARHIFDKIEAIPFGLIISVFLFYFVGAYLFYGSLFAAIGSAVDSETDAQQFQVPVTLPLIFSLVVLAAILRDPHGSLAVWLSIIPFTSPIVMMMRVPFMENQLWEIFVSMGVLAVSIVFTIWMAAKIYRIGILTYGSKVSYHTLFKWIFAKN